MKEIIFGIIAGIVASLGMGGGVTLLLLFSIFSNLDQHILQGINLIFFVPTSIVAILINIKNKKIDYVAGLYIIVPGIVGAILGSKISFIIDSTNLRKYFGIFLLCIAIFEIYGLFKQYIIAKKENNN